MLGCTAFFMSASHKVSMVDEALDAKQSAKLGAQQDVPKSAATWEANSLNHFGS
jgi:hypothetical protein